MISDYTMKKIKRSRTLGEVGHRCHFKKEKREQSDM